jgi:hypothetical protein
MQPLNLLRYFSDACICGTPAGPPVLPCEKKASKSASQGSVLVWADWMFGSKNQPFLGSGYENLVYFPLKSLCFGRSRLI